jgi:hypothetical protein
VGLGTQWVALGLSEGHPKEEVRMDVDLLVNPKIMGTADLETVEIPTLSFEDVPSSSSSAPPPPKLVPSFEEAGPVKLDGIDNFNADAYSTPAPTRTVKMSDDALMKEKYEILRKFERLSKLGVPMRKRFTIDSPLEEMKMELEFIKREKSMDATIKQFSEWFVTGMSAMEWGSKNVGLMKAFGLQLDGLSEAAQMNVVDLEDDFEELYDLYGENMKMHPLVRIPLRTCMMIYMVHLTNQMTRKAPIPNIDDIMRQNPDIARQLAAAAMQNQTQQMRGSAAIPPPQPPSNPLGGLMSFMQQGMPPPPPPNLIPKVSDSKPIQIGVIPKKPAIKQSVPPPAPPKPAVEMKSPTVNIDDLLKDIKQQVLPPVGNGPPPPEKIKKPGNKAGSTGKNSVVIKL